MLSEPEITILTGLKSCIVNEGEDVHFECLVSHDNALIVQWTLQDVPLQNNEMNEIRMECKRHTLTLRSVTQKDSGTVSFHVGDHTSFACLTVRGKTEELFRCIYFHSLNDHSGFQTHALLCTCLVCLIILYPYIYSIHSTYVIYLAFDACFNASYCKKIIII